MKQLEELEAQCRNAKARGEARVALPQIARDAAREMAR
jgi:hypothetical protein